jgi:GNAT superfamily N-acetyltransferase
MMDRLKLMDEKKNPFYQHAVNAWFLAERDGKVVGRIAAIVNKNHNDFYHDKTGFFGFFESVDDADVAKALLSEAEKFLREQGMSRALGPASPSTNDEMGVLIDGFDTPPTLLMTHNPPYYDSLLKKCGYGKAKDMYAYMLSQSEAMSPKLKRVTDALEARANVKVRSMDPKQFAREVGIIKELYNQAWEQNWAFVPFTEAEIDLLAKDLKMIYDPELVLFAELDRKTVGFALSVPNVNQAFTAGPRIPTGALNLPIALWNLFTKKKAIDTVRIIVLGVLKEYRGRGIDAVLYRKTMEVAKRKGYEYGEASWILEDNEQMNRAAMMMNGKRYKTYRMYEKPL